MQYGHFDDEAREYVITRPDTPQPWANYLGSTRFGGIITNNAGGYGFYQSAARGRFLRFRPNALPPDQPGRYVYLRDDETGDYWSASWQPVGRPLSVYESTCRHGLGYTAIGSRYAGISCETTYFIPLDADLECWRLRLSNETDRSRALSLFTYCEFTNQWDTYQDQVNLQYSLFIVRGGLVDGILRVAIQDNLRPKSEAVLLSDVPRHVWMALVGAPLAGYDTSREAFIGPHRGYRDPRAVERGRTSQTNAYGDNACGALQADVSLGPHDTRDVLVLLGIGEASIVGKRSLAEFGSITRADRELERLRETWAGRLAALQAKTPDPDLDHTVNVWGPYNALITHAWSRSASLVYSGERDGLGFRDSVQDVLGVTAAIPDEARGRLELLLTGQVSSGGAMPVVRPFEHRPGRETGPAPDAYRSDDALWLLNAVPAYVAETGDLDFYRKVLPYANRGEDTVLAHLRRAIEFNLERTGRSGLPCGLAADWNDCLRLGYRGESLMVAFQLRLGLSTYAAIASRLGREAEAAWALARREALDARIQDCAWDGDWFIWAIGEDGTVYGSRRCAEGQIYLNTQTWAVLSGAASPQQAARCMQSVSERLATPYGLMLCAPPFVRTSIDVMRAVVFNPGVKENAGIFNHTQGWAVIAECLLGHGDQAYAYCRAAMPAAYNDRADLRQVEPYVQAQTTYSPFSPRAGTSRTPWLTGAAAWSQVAACQYILGIRPEVDGLRVAPCVPRAWDGFTVERRFRSKAIALEVCNPDHVFCGVRSLVLNGERLSGTLIPAERLLPQNEVEVVLGSGPNAERPGPRA